MTLQCQPIPDQLARLKRGQLNLLMQFFLHKTRYSKIFVFLKYGKSSFIFGLFNTVHLSSYKTDTGSWVCGDFIEIGIATGR